MLFIHTLQSIPSAAAAELGTRLLVIPPFDDLFSGFTGKEVIDPAGQNAKTYEGLMRTMHSTVYALAGQTIRERWEVLARVGALLWDEQSAVERILAQSKAYEADQDGEDEEFDSDEENGGHKCCGGHHDHD